MDNKLLSLLISSAYAAYSSSLIGTNLEGVNKRFRFFQDIKPGNLVMEISSMFVRSPDAIRIGYLDRIVREPYPVPPSMTEEEYKAEYEPDLPPTETVHYIKSVLDDKEIRWTNAQFIRVVDDWKVFP
jgi:hypothetical protein